MELVKSYLENITLIADFWIANNDKNIVSFKNEGIAIKKSDLYMGKYFISIILKKHHHKKLEKSFAGWDKRFPKAVITKGDHSVDAYDLRFIKSVEQGKNVVLEFVGVIPK